MVLRTMNSLRMSFWMVPASFWRHYPVPRQPPPARQNQHRTVHGHRHRHRPQVDAGEQLPRTSRIESMATPPFADVTGHARVGRSRIAGG